MLLLLSSIDGEQFVGDQEYYFDEQDQYEQFVQLSLFPLNFNTFNSCCMCHLDRDSLEIELIPYLLWDMHWVALLVLN